MPRRSPPRYGEDLISRPYTTDQLLEMHDAFVASMQRAGYAITEPINARNEYVVRRPPFARPVARLSAARCRGSRRGVRIALAGFLRLSRSYSHSYPRASCFSWAGANSLFLLVGAPGLEPGAR